MLGDVSVGSCGLQLKRGQFYASGAMVAGYESMFPIDIETLVLSDQSEVVLE